MWWIKINDDESIIYINLLLLHELRAPVDKNIVWGLVHQFFFFLAPPNCKVGQVPLAYLATPGL